MKRILLSILFLHLLKAGAMAQEVDSLSIVSELIYFKDSTIKPVYRRDTLWSAGETVAMDEAVNTALAVAPLSASNEDAGRVAGVVDVSPTGAATYTLPLSLPPGLNGAVPQVALTYNSQGGNGVAGYGWNISGMSSISRIGATKFHDGYMGINERFALDGQRLLLKSGTYGAAGSEYQTENYSNIRIRAKETNLYLGGPLLLYFEVWYPDGTKAIYGTTEASRTAGEFALSRVEKTNGAIITYSYQKTTSPSTSLYLTDIAYGGHIYDETAINHISFVYQDATRFEQGFVAGVNFTRSKILKEINITANGQGYRNYVLAYSEIYPLKYQKLASITEYNGDKTVSKDPLYFSYNLTPSWLTYKTISNFGLSNIKSENSSTLTADFNGNGAMDFMVCPTPKNKLYMVFDPYGDGPENNLVYQITTGTYKDVFSVNYLSSDNKLSAGQGFVLTRDYGHSVRFDVQSVTPNSSGSGYSVKKDYDKTWTVPTVIIPPEYNGDLSYEVPIEYELFSGDFNGDGLADLVIVTLPTVTNPRWGDAYYVGNTMARFANLDRRLAGNISSPVRNLVKVYEYKDKIYTGDFNGDGKTDLLHLTNGAVYVYTLDGNDGFTLLWYYADSQIKRDFGALLGDYNGDGKMDFMLPTADEGNNNNYFRSFISTGTTFVKHGKNYQFNNIKNQFDGNVMILNHLIPSDLNGDGKTDILYLRTATWEGQTQGDLTINVWYNEGTNRPSMEGVTAPSFALGSSENLNTNLIHYPSPLFLNADKKNFKLEFGVISDRTVSVFRMQKDIKKESQLSSISHRGVTYELEYNLLEPEAHNGEFSIYRGGKNQQYPYVDISYAPGLYAVSKMKRSYNGTSLEQVFGYREAVSHIQGLGFLGFSQTIRSNWHAGESDANRMFNISFHDPQKRGAVINNFTSRSHEISSSILNATSLPEDLELSAWNGNLAEATRSIKLLPGFATDGSFTARIVDPSVATGPVDDGATLNDYITRTNYNYNTQLLTNKVFINVPTEVHSKNLLEGTSQSQQFTYDGYYNVTKEETDIGGQATHTTEMTYRNYSGETSYYIGYPLTKKTTAGNGSDTFTAEEQYTYDLTYFPTSIRRKGHNTAFITENLEYDNYRNITKKTLVTAAGQRVTSSTYDASGRFVTSQTDADGMTANYTYNQSTGNALTTTNPYSQTESYTYDTWGRLTESTDYLGKKTYRTYTKSGTDTHLAESDEEGNEGLKVVNALGQTTQTAGKDITGQWIYKSMIYDIYGRLIKESEPYTASPTQWNETQYDEYGRVSQTLSYTGQTTNITYSGLSTAVNDGTKSVTTTKNALGQVASVQDPGGTINYTYDAAGNLKTANYDGMAQSIAYDGWGRKTQLTDPSAGTYNYEYNDFGELTKEITPKGTTTYSYDAAGKLSGKTLTGDQTNMIWAYTYNNTTKLLEQLAFTNADGNNATYTYTYDSHKRPAGVIENNLHAIFTKSFTYDAFGRVSTETSQAQDKASSRTASRTLEYHYQNGGLLKVTDQATGQRIHEVSSLNARGQVTTALMSSNLKQSDSYDSYGLPQNFITQKLGSTTTDLLNLGYSFNAERGLLNSRSNSAFSWNETFSYDNLDRLTAFNDNNGNNSHSYDSRGRITNNSQLGDYAYTGSSYQQQELTNPTPAAETWYTDRSLQQITYNAFKSPVEINEENKEIISFRYNAALQRAHMYYGETETNAEDRRYRRHYSEDGSMEITNDTQTGTTSFVFYLGGDAYSAPAIWKEVQTTAQTTQQLYYLHRDHLGSIVLITDDAGNIAEKRQFDAWGNIVKLEDGNGNPLAAFVILDRGYTGHEHLLGVALIHMNGRLYDPMLHRFLSPDNYVQDPYNTQNFNRYGYVLNNPLSHVDPSGEWFFSFILPGIGTVIDAALWGATIGGAGYTASVAFSDGGFKNWNWGDFGKSVGIGAASGVVTLGIGNAFGAVGSGGVWGELGRAYAHGFSNGFISQMTGGDFMQSFASGALGSLAGSGFETWAPGLAEKAWGGIGFSAVSGGVGAELTGGDFWRGAATGATVGLLNHAQNSIIRNRIAKMAENNLHSTDWSYDSAIDDFPEGTNKCNKFVYDITSQSGASPGKTNGGKWPPTAGDWANPDYKIKNWKVVRFPSRGDVVAYSYRYSDATGHVAIINSNTTSIGANHNIVRQTNFGFSLSHLPAGTNYVYRRYTGR